MRAPPAVSIDVTPGRGWVAVQLVLYVIAAAALAVWGATHLQVSPGHIAAAGLLAAALVAALALRTIDRRTWRLTWTGAQWQLRRTDVVAPPLDCEAPQVKIDLDRWLLVRVQPQAEGRGVWLPVAQAGAGASFRPWCAAVYWSAPNQRRGSAEEPGPF